MELQTVIFEQAKTLLNIGFPKYGMSDEYYDNDGNICDKNCDMKKLVYPKPTLELVAKWLRLKKKINIDIVPVEENENARRMGIDIIYQINIFYSVHDEHNQEFRHAYYIDTPLDELIKLYESESDNWTDEQWEFYDNEIENHKYFTDYEDALSTAITKSFKFVNL